MLSVAANLAPLWLLRALSMKKGHPLLECSYARLLRFCAVSPTTRKGNVCQSNKKTKKAHKYGASKTEHHGFSFSSKLEAAVYDILYLQKLAGEIFDIQVQDSIKLTEAEIEYRPDFKVTVANGVTRWVEAKGFKTAVWQIKKRLWKAYGPGELWIYEGSHTKPRLAEIIQGKK